LRKQAKTGIAGSKDAAQSLTDNTDDEGASQKVDTHHQNKANAKYVTSESTDDANNKDSGTQIHDHKSSHALLEEDNASDLTPHPSSTNPNVGQEFHEKERGEGSCFVDDKLKPKNEFPLQFTERHSQQIYQKKVAVATATIASQKQAKIGTAGSKDEAQKLKDVGGDSSMI
jgi:hypothetical protein